MDAKLAEAQPVAKRRVEALSSMMAFRLWLVLAGGFSAVFAFQSYYPWLIGPLSNILPAVCASLAFLSSYLCIRRYGLDLTKRFPTVWFLFALGTGLWLAAEVTWASYYFVLQVDVPYPSLADVFYVGGYAPMLIGSFFYLKMFSPGMNRRRLTLALLLIGVSIAIVIGFVLPAEFATSQSLITTITGLSYPVLDLSLVSITILSLAIFFGGRLASWWILFGGAAALYIVGDELFLYQVAAGTYYNGSFDDLIFLLGYLTFALAFYVHRKAF